VRGLGTESAFTVLARAKQLEDAGRDVLHLEIGEPDFPTPPHIVEAAIRGLRDGCTRYAPVAGLAELRDVIADSMRARGLSAHAGQVLVTSGSKPMLYYALLAVIEPGDEVLVPDPGFPIYESVVRFAQAQPVRYSVDALHELGVSPEEIAARVTPRTRVIVINSPHNPTGVVIGMRGLARIAEIALQHDLIVVSDEIYSQLQFDGWPSTIASLPGMAPRTVVVDGFSKAYAMTGWRLGYGVVPPRLVNSIERLIINTTSCAPPFVQVAGLAALQGPQDAVREMAREFRHRRDVLVAGLNQVAGFSCSLPGGAFYAFPRIAELLTQRGLTAESFADGLLEEYGLACLPGTAFGPRGEGYLRLSFANSRTVLEQALDRLRQASMQPLAGPLRSAGGGVVSR
jgi:aspartate aminotransferase